nr:VanZ family protein [Nakamurella flavida]
MVVFVVVVAFIVFWPSPPAQEAQEGLGALLRRWHAKGLPGWISFSLVESVSNGLMFVPIGVFGALSLARRRWLVVLAAAAASGLIELTQQVLLPGRFADPRDVAANTGGALIGLVFAWIWDMRRTHRDRTRVLRTGRPDPAEPTPARRG